MRIAWTLLAMLALCAGMGVARGASPPVGGSVVLHSLPQSAIAKLCLRLDPVNYRVRISRARAITAVERDRFIARSGMKLQIIEARIALVHLRNHYLFDVSGPLWLLVSRYKRALEPTLFFVNARSGTYMDYLKVGQPCLP